MKHLNSIYGNVSRIGNGTETYFLVKTYGHRLREIYEIIEDVFWEKELTILRKYWKKNIQASLLLDESGTNLLGIGIYMIRQHGHIPWLLIHESTRNKNLGHIILLKIFDDMRGRVEIVRVSPQNRTSTELAWHRTKKICQRKYGLTLINDDMNEHLAL